MIPPEEIIALLNQKPGYEAVHLLLQSSQRRKRLAEYTGYDGGTLSRWISEAEEMGLIEKNSFVDNNEEKYTEISRATPVPKLLIPVIKTRGGDGPRDERGDHADKGKVNKWFDEYDTDNIISHIQNNTDTHELVK
jgi:hypothetical protein